MLKSLALLIAFSNQKDVLFEIKIKRKRRLHYCYRTEKAGSASIRWTKH